ncbi:MAG: helix-turn-helix domain-containing protein [Candidatus Woesearchaeota archaeon]
MDELLRRFGLTDNEIKVYKTLLAYGSSLAGEITTKTGIHRRNVYDSIERLIKKGLVGYVTKSNKKFFQATNPRHFLALIEKEHEDLRCREEELKKILPSLLLTQRTTKEKQRVTVFEGRNGLITVLNDILKTNRPNICYSTTRIRFIKTYLSWFHEKRVRTRLKDRIILNEKETKRAGFLSKLPYTQVRFIQKEFDSPLALNVYADKVGMLIFSDNPIAILIEDRNVAASFRKYFELLWEMAREV